MKVWQSTQIVTELGVNGNPQLSIFVVLFCNSLEKLNEMKLFSMFHMGKFWVEGKASQQSA